MPFLELSALFVVAAYIVLRTLEHPKPRRFLVGLALVCVASWIAEESCILLFNFYQYNPIWGLFLGEVPVLVIVIWPVIIHSAWDLASQLLLRGYRLVPLVAAGIVLTDALFIEPVAVSAGLWSWNEPGIFDVPPIVFLGWAYFAFLCVLLLEQRGQRVGAIGRALLLLVLPAIGTLFLLLITWWGGLRWVNTSINPRFAVWTAWGISLLLSYAILRHHTGTHVYRKTLLFRLPAALLLFGLLALDKHRPSLLVPYATAFVPPYLTLMAQQYLRRP